MSYADLQLAIPNPKSDTIVSPSPSVSFSRYSDENLKDTVRNTDAELLRRPVRAANIQTDVSLEVFFVYQKLTNLIRTQNNIVAPQPRRVVATMPNDIASAKLPVIRQIQSPHSRRVLSPEAGRRPNSRATPSRIHSPHCHASSRSSASSLLSSDYVNVCSDDAVESLDSCEEPGSHRVKSRTGQRRVAESRQSQMDANKRVRDAETRNLTLRSLICPLAVPPAPHLTAAEEEQDVQARLLLRDALKTSSTDSILSCPHNLADTLLKLMQRVRVIRLILLPLQSHTHFCTQTLDYHRQKCDMRNFTHGKLIGRLIVKLSRTSQMAPDLVHITGVTDVSGDICNGGSFADIYVAKWKHQDVALKRLRIFDSTQESTAIRNVCPHTTIIHPSLTDTVVLQAFNREAIIWRQLDHQFILPFYGIDQQTFANRPCMVSPFVRKGNVMMVIRGMNAGEIPYNRWVRCLLNTFHNDGILTIQLASRDRTRSRIFTQHRHRPR